MKVTLIQPPIESAISGVYVGPNVGLAYIAAVLEKNGFSVSVIEANAQKLTLPEVIERIKSIQPALVGSGGQTPVSPSSLEIFKAVKTQIGQDIITVAGGPHFTFTAEESLQKCPELDVVVRGEGELTVLDLCRHIEHKKSFSSIAGITYRNSSGKIIENPDREQINNLNALPFPAWHLFPVDKYHWIGHRQIGIISSRGCSFSCPHCITWKMHKGIRLRSPKSIVEEMTMVKRNFRHDTFFFHDDQTFLIREQLEGFLEELEKSREQFYWCFETRPDTFMQYRDLWERMKTCGMYKVVFGFDSLNRDIRAYYNRENFNKTDFEEILYYLEKNLDILTSVYFLIGSPLDTEDTIKETIQYAKHLYPKRCSFVVATLLVPFPGTDLYDQIREKGLLLQDDYKYYGFAESVIKTPVPTEKLMKFYGDIWKETYTGWRVYKKRFLDLFSKNEFRRCLGRNYFKTALFVLRTMRQKASKEYT